MHNGDLIAGVIQYCAPWGRVVSLSETGADWYGCHTSFPVNNMHRGHASFPWTNGHGGQALLTGTHEQRSYGCI